MTILDVIAVAAGGFLGAVIRYVVSKKLNSNVSIPVGTFIVNMIGCLLIGFVASLGLSIPLTFFLISGLTGALTTFSTWIKEVLGMSRLHEWGKASTYMLGSILLGILFVYVGYISGSFFSV